MLINYPKGTTKFTMYNQPIQKYHSYIFLIINLLSIMVTPHYYSTKIGDSMPYSCFWASPIIVSFWPNFSQHLTPMTKSNVKLSTILSYKQLIIIYLYGIQLLPSASLLIQLPNDSKLLLILAPSLNLSPTQPVAEALSLPAKSIIDSLTRRS